MLITLSGGLLENKSVMIRYLIKGITCTGCIEDMENILLGMQGVKEATLNYAGGVLTIRYKPGEIDTKTIVKKVKNLGFKSKLL